MEKVGVACSGGFALWQLPGMRGEGVGNGGGPSGHGMLLQLCFVTTAEDAGWRAGDAGEGVGNGGCNEGMWVRSEV